MGEAEGVGWDYRNRLAVESVLLDYCDLVDALDFDGIVNLFTEDCEFDFGFGRVRRGRREIHEQMSSRLGTDYTHTSHHLSNIRIGFNDQAHATARSHVFAWHRQASDGRERKLFGRYFDNLALTLDGWKISRRVLRMAGEDGYPRVPDQASPWELIPRRGRQ